MNESSNQIMYFADFPACYETHNFNVLDKYSQFFSKRYSQLILCLTKPIYINRTAYFYDIFLYIILKLTLSIRSDSKPFRKLEGVI